MQIKLHFKKTEMVIFKSKQTKLEDDLTIKLCGKRLYLTENVIYLYSITVSAIELWNKM